MPSPCARNPSSRPRNRPSRPARRPRSSLTERQKNLEKQEQRLQSKEEGLDKKTQAGGPEGQGSRDPDREAQGRHGKAGAQQAEAKRLIEAQAKRLEEIAGLTREDAKKELISQLEYTAKMDAAKLVRRIEDEAQEEAAKKARWTIGAAIQRVASDVVAETGREFGPAAQRRPQGPHHRPGGPQHPGPGKGHGLRPDRGRHAGEHRRLQLRPHPPRSGPAGHPQAAGRRPHPPRPHRGGGGEGQAGHGPAPQGDRRGRVPSSWASRTSTPSCTSSSAA